MRSKTLLIKLFAVLGITSLVFLAGCGSSTANAGNQQSTGAISVSVSPMTAEVQVGMSQQFTATVQNDTANKGVTWRVGDGSCPVSDCGTIDSAGKYTASATVHFTSPLFITATSVADPSKTATAVVTVTPAPTGVAVSPTIATVQNNGVQQFTATGDPFGTIPVVTWNVSGTNCTGASCGTIDSTGKYTAPATPPNPPTVTVTAASVADSSKSGSATVILGSNPNNAKLNGQYAFLFNGYNGDGNVTFAGSFSADGNGNISAGTADLNFTGDSIVLTNQAFTGTYSVGSDNRGSMTITTLSPISQGFSFALDSFASGVAGRGRLVELDSTARGTGILAKQDPAAFSAAAITGGYAFSLAGTSRFDWALVAAGRFTASGGALSVGQIDVYGGLDLSGTPTAALDLPFAGTYAVSSNGRGTAVLTFSGQDPGFSNFSFYVISASELLLIELDTCPANKVCTFQTGISGGISGLALQQSGAPFSANSLDGAAVFNLDRGSVSVGDVTVGREIFDGSGNLSGTSDENNGGVITSNSVFTGTYSVGTDGLGRGVITLAGNPQPKPFYLVSPGKAFIIDTSGSAEAGMFEPQTAALFSNASLSGDYVLGTLPPPLNWVFSPISGVVTTNGSGGLSGTSDGTAGTAESFAATYSVAANGRVTLAITPSAGPPSNMVFYLISPSRAVGIPLDGGATNIASSVIEN